MPIPSPLNETRENLCHNLALATEYESEMHDLPTRDDSILLARWARDGSEDAFAELVNHYQRLVLGAALRRTGDAELARDVAQQVFATLAAKAHLLIGRVNLAGWLYYAASHIAARAARAEQRRRQHQQSLGEMLPASEHHPNWPLLEEALGALGGIERESLVLHYFEDLSYPEIAAALGIEQTAARKRVSRALQSLELQIRRRGLRGSVTALLAGAVAQQCGITAQAGLASAAIAASATGGATWLLGLNTLMSQTSLKIAACASALVLTPLVFQMHANSALRSEVRELRRTPPGIVASASDAASLHKKQAALRDAVLAKRAARIAAENRVGELAALKKTLSQEVVISLGTVESMARKVAGMLWKMDQLDNTIGDKGELKPEVIEERERHAREIAEVMPELLAIVHEIPKLERDPAKAARFYATTFAEVAGLDDGARTTMEEEFASWIRGLQQEGLTLVQRPPGAVPEWDTRRKEARAKLFAALQAKLPLPQEGHPQWADLVRIGDAADRLNESLDNGGRP
jgi:RNA polymerase sigma factor (sigma-70 family)